VTLDGGYLQNIEDFDPLAYGIGNTEAAAISIQQRLALKVAHACLDDAKIPYRARNIGIL
jgi:acyl transferase domain-containing protein